MLLTNFAAAKYVNAREISGAPRGKYVNAMLRTNFTAAKYVNARGISGFPAA